jgi:hypothetical protein
VTIGLQNYFLARGWIEKQQQQLPHPPRENTVDFHRTRDFSDNQEEELSRIIRRTSMNSAGTHITSARESPPLFVHVVPPSAPELLKRKANCQEQKL